MRQRAGYTLTEVLLVVGILSLLLGIGAPVYQTFQLTNEVDVATNTLAQDLYRAQAQSRAVGQDSPWGVSVQGNTITLFVGTSYASRSQALDETYTVASAVTLAGPSEIVFARQSGSPSAVGTYTITSSTKARSLSINTKGMVDY